MEARELLGQRGGAVKASQREKPGFGGFGPLSG